MLALIRPDSWNLPLFLHVLGAILLFGGTGTIAVLGFAARGRTAHAELLARLAARTWLILVVPAWIVMRVGAQLIVDKEFPHKTPGWVNVGFAVSEGGGLLLLVLGVLAWLSARRGGGGRLSVAVSILASVYVVALGVASWAMATKPT